MFIAIPLMKPSVDTLEGLGRAGRVYSILKNWPERRVKAICVTDGERVGFLGDLGVQAVGVPISKLALYSACAGIPPTVCLPVCIDAGENLPLFAMNNPLYSQRWPRTLACACHLGSSKT